ncbi:MAG TPA: glycosyltransferase family 2 protein [Acidimicrobiales bacterium]|nr:glycosyltransferase family 2 protein [Acidimicrobiales bacterium]
MTARVSAVVVNYNAREHLLRCIRSLRAEGLDEIVVADNASVDGSEAAVRAADPEVVYVQTGANLGYGTGCNRGAARTDPARPYLLCLNADALLQPGALAAMAAVLDARPEVAIVGPRIVDPDGTLYPSVRTFPSLGDAIGHAFLGLVWAGNPFTRRYRMLDHDHERGGDVEWVSGSGFLARRAAWDAIGGFDEGYFMYAEDSDLCWRARQAGWTVTFEPTAEIVHVQGVSTDRHPYRMIAAHHRAILRFAGRTTTGPRRLLLPVMAVALAVRTPLAWLHRALAGRARRAGRTEPVG